jgi:uncharacterized protein
VLVVDAGPLYAYVDADDAHHDACLALMEDHPGPLVVPMLVVMEVAYLLASRLGHEAEVRLGTVDASIVAACERLGVRTVATLDRRHFSVVRPRHLPAFEIVP